MKLKEGSKYKFTNINNNEWVIMEVIRDISNIYIVNILEINNGFNSLQSNNRTFIHKDGIMFRSYTIDLIIEPDTEIIYTKELIDLYIEMALQTGDKEWFKEIMERRDLVVKLS